MSLKYVSAYLMAVLAGTPQPTSSNIRDILGVVGAEVDDAILNKLLSEMAGKSASEVIASGMSKLQSVSGAAQVASAPTTSAAVEEKAAPEKPVEEEEEEDDDMGFSLFD